MLFTTDCQRPTDPQGLSTCTRSLVEQFKQLSRGILDITNPERNIDRFCLRTAAADTNLAYLTLFHDESYSINSRHGTSCTNVARSCRLQRSQLLESSIRRYIVSPMVLTFFTDTHSFERTRTTRSFTRTKNQVISNVSRSMLR
jgi:hypothetical protein